MPWAACLLYDWCLRKGKAGGCPWVLSHWLLTGSWGVLRSEGMSALGPYSGHTFCKPNILDRQRWLRPDHLCLPVEVKLMPGMNTWKGIHSVFPQACIHPCLEHHVGLVLPEVLSCPNSPIILRKVGPSSWISLLHTVGFRHVLKTPERVSSSISLIQWGSKPAQELIAAGGYRKAWDDSLQGSLGPVLHICVVQTWRQIPSVLLRLLSPQVWAPEGSGLMWTSSDVSFRLPSWYILA